MADVMVNNDILTKMQQFIVQGYFKIEPNESNKNVAKVDADTIHQRVLECPMDTPNQLYHSLRSPGGDAAGNNLLHVAPKELMGTSFLQSPKLIAVLNKLLGEDYRFHPHARTHLREKGAETTMWHVDIHKGAWISPRYHTPHYLIISYYPQDTTLAMGPTEVLPGTQYYRCDHDMENFNRGSYPNLQKQIDTWATKSQPFICKAGTIMIMHYDLWHRALKCTDANANRLMLKFVAYRTKLPSLTSLTKLPIFPLLSSLKTLSIKNYEDEEEIIEKLVYSEPLLEFLKYKRKLDKSILMNVLKKDFAASFEADMESDIINLQQSEEWKITIENKMFKDQTNVSIQRIGEKMMFKYLMKTTVKQYVNNGKILNNQIPLLVPYLKLHAIPDNFNKLVEKKRMLKFVKDRKVIWNYIWRWLFGFHKYNNNNNNNNSIRGDDNEIMMNKTTTIDDMKHLVELEAMAICKYEPERLSAAYTLAETKEGTAILNNIIKNTSVLTSVRRTAFYGLLSSTHNSNNMKNIVSKNLMRQSNDNLTTNPIFVKRIEMNANKRFSPSFIRANDGFDAESLLNATDKIAEAEYLSIKTIILSPIFLMNNNMSQFILSLADGERKEYTTIASIRAAIESLGYLNEKNSKDTIIKTIDILASCIDDRSNLTRDGGLRVLACKSLAMISSRCYISNVVTNAVGKYVSMIVHILHEDIDRYVRCHAYEILICYLSGMIMEKSFEMKNAQNILFVKTALLTKNISSERIDQFVKKISSIAKEKLGDNDELSIFINNHIRSFCCLRRCPLTSPESPW